MLETELLGLTGIVVEHSTALLRHSSGEGVEGYWMGGPHSMSGERGGEEGR